MKDMKGAGSPFLDRPISSVINPWPNLDAKIMDETFIC